MDYSKLTDRELDARIAKITGAECDNCGTVCCNCDHVRIGSSTPYYSTDLNAARELEEEIERRGMAATSQWWDYIDVLMDICRPDGDWMVLSQHRVGWICATATARHRAEAFCGAMESK